MKIKQDEYQTTRIWKRTHARLRFIAAITGVSIVEMLDRLTREELERINQRQEKKLEQERKGK